MEEKVVSNWAIVEDGIVTNMIVADEDFAKEIGALPEYEGCRIGEAYDPPVDPEPQIPPTELEQFEAQLTYTAMMTDTLLPINEENEPKEETDNV